MFLLKLLNFCFWKGTSGLYMLRNRWGEVEMSTLSEESLSSLVVWLILILNKPRLWTYIFTIERTHLFSRFYAAGFWTFSCFTGANYIFLSFINDNFSLRLHIKFSEVSMDVWFYVMESKISKGIRKSTDKQVRICNQIWYLR